MSFPYSGRASVGVAILFALVAPSGCTSPKPPGSVVVTFSTKQGDENLFVWGVSLDGASPHTIQSSASGRFAFDAVSAGDHHLILSSLPKACTSGSDDRLVSVPSRDTARVTIDVKCTRITGDIALTVATSGVELDADGYTVNLDGIVGPHVVASSAASVLLAKATPGSHEVTLSGLASNCSVAATEPHTAVVIVDQSVPMSINVVCRSTAAAIRVVTTTNASSTSDPDGYLLTVGTQTNIPAATNAATSVTVTPGTYDVTLGDIEPSCTVSSPTRNVTVGKSETVTINFDVTCGAYPATVAGVTSTDPANDTLPNATNNAAAAFDVVAVSTRYASTFIAISLKFNRSVASANLGGVVDLDLDENPSTGVTPLMNSYGGSAAQGAEARINFSTASGGAAVLLSTTANPFAIRVIADGDSVQFILPYVKLKDDGNMTITTIIGTPDRPTDYAPNSGVLVSHLPAGLIAQNHFDRSRTIQATTFMSAKQMTWAKPK